MIVDNIKNAHMYYALGERFEKALKYIQENDLLEFENGKYEILGDEVFIIVQDYTSKKLEAGKFEAHRKYIDIQYVIKGQERLGYSNIEKFKPDCDYDEDKDLIFGDVESGSLVLAQAGDFVIFTPEDAHMPSICVDRPYYVKKAVIKLLSK